MLPVAAPREETLDQPVTSACPCDDGLFLDAEPLMKAIGERQAAERMIREIADAAWVRDDGDVASRHGAFDGDCGQHADLPSTDHDHAR